MNELTSNQVSDWEAYDRLDPIGSYRADFRMASLSATVTNLALSIYGKENTKLKTPAEFMPEWDSILAEEMVEDKKRQSANEMRDILLQIAGTQNRSIDKKNKK